MKNSVGMLVGIVIHVGHPPLIYMFVLIIFLSRRGQ